MGAQVGDRIVVASQKVGRAAREGEILEIIGEETDSFRGDKVTFDITNLDTGIPAVPGHYSTSEILGFDPPPGVALQIQGAFRPAK